MGQPAKKQEPILVIDKQIQDAIDEHRWLLRDVLVAYRVPDEKWNDIWVIWDLEAEGMIETPEGELVKIDKDLAEVGEDLTAQGLVGWFRGVALILGISVQSVVTL